MKPKRGHDEQHLDITGMAGTEFRLILRQSRINILDFSIILAVLVPQSTQVFRLRRYNGSFRVPESHIWSVQVGKGGAVTVNATNGGFYEATNGNAVLASLGFDETGDPLEPNIRSV